MFTSEDILARLQDGDSVDAIATEMANALNAAKTAYDEAEAKRIEEEKRIDQEREQKRALVDNIFQGVIAYLEHTGHQDMANKLINSTDTDVDEIAEAFDAMIELAEMTEKLKVLEYGNPVVMKKVPKPVQKVVKRTPDDIISEFLKTL